jgi:hypothetical protein
MPLVSSSIANLVNGVSQQPYTLRLASQAEIQENGLSTVAQGLKKRPPTRHIKKISDTPIGLAYVHTINRDETERYIVVITNGDLKVYDLEGNQKTVNFPSGKAYLGASDPTTQFRAVTVADYTFVVNKSVVAKESQFVIASRPHEALIVVRNGLYGKTYTVSHSQGGNTSFATPDGTVASHAAQIATDYIAAQVMTGLTVGSVTATNYGSVILLSSPTPFTVSTSDGYADAAMFAVKGQLQRFSDLPHNAGVDGFTVEIVGDKTSAFDNYWVKFDRSSGGAGVWRETVKPGLNVGVNNATMPYALIREADGTFTFRPLEWGDRVVGDEKSAPQPSFVNRKIQDVFFYRNRLGVIADESVVFSEAGEFFNFYPTTVTDLLDSDRIDVSVSHTKVSNLVAAVPFSKQLLLFSAQTQFSVESGDLLTPRTISIKPTTEFECNPIAQPEGIGKVVYFAVPKGDYSGVREYYVDTDNGMNDAADVTSHVPKYLPQGVYKLIAGLNEDTLCALTFNEPNAIYVYKFYWNNNEKLQSSWSKWTFPETDFILNADFLQSELTMVINRPDGLYLETLNVSLGEVLEAEPYVVHLDRKKLVTKNLLTYSAPHTILTPGALGWSPNDGEYVAVVAAGQGPKTGSLLPIEWDGTNGKIVGDYSDCDLIVGRKYTFRYRFSTIVPKQRSRNGGEQSDSVARLQLRNMQVNYADTGYFQAKVTPRGRPTYTYTFSGKTLGLASATIGTINLETGKFRFPIMSQNTTVDIELFSDSPLPFSFLSADWEGLYAKRSQGI